MVQYCYLARDLQLQAFPEFVSGTSPFSDIPPEIQTTAIMANFESMLSALEKSFTPAREVCAIIIFVLRGEN